MAASPPISTTSGCSQEGAARGDVRPDLDLELAAMLIAAMVNEVSTLLITRLGLTAEQAVGGDLARFADPRPYSGQ